MSGSQCRCCFHWEASSPRQWDCWWASQRFAFKGDYLAVATLGFGEIIRIVITNTNAIGPFEVRGSQGLRVPVLADLFWVYLWVAVCVAGIWRLVHSTMGKAFLAVREDEIAATAMGVNTTFFKVLAFAIGAFFAGVAGGLQATAFILIDPKGFGFIQSVLFVVMVVLGGSGSITGVVLAAVVLTWLPEQLRSLKSLHVEDLRMVIFSLLLMWDDARAPRRTSRPSRTVVDAPKNGHRPNPSIDRYCATDIEHRSVISKFHPWHYLKLKTSHFDSAAFER